MSSWRTEIKGVVDPRWKTPAIKLLQHAEVPVVPIWFDGANSLVFQMLGMIPEPAHACVAHGNASHAWANGAHAHR
ncbi:MAG: hypothetical protein IPG92_08985 [Flavobacteriales bacterium]|nr:hypothetical protein [Flavobacteriales bacterium]